MPNPENLIPAKPGEVRNPHGRPVGSRNRSTLLAEYAGLRVKKNGLNGDEIEATAEEFAMMALIRKCWEGDVAAIKELQDTLYGKITDKIEATVDATVANKDLTDKAIKSMSDDQIAAILGGQTLGNKPSD